MESLDEGAGKGPEPRPVVRKKWDDCPLWDNIGPEARKKKGKREKDMKKTRGFTLIELLVVIAIFAILAGMILPAVRSAINKTSDSDAESITPVETPVETPISR